MHELSKEGQIQASLCRRRYETAQGWTEIARHIGPSLTYSGARHGRTRLRPAIRHATCARSSVDRRGAPVLPQQPTVLEQLLLRAT